MSSINALYTHSLPHALSMRTTLLCVCVSQVLMDSINAHTCTYTYTHINTSLLMGTTLLCVAGAHGLHQCTHAHTHMHTHIHTHIHSHKYIALNAYHPFVCLCVAGAHGHQQARHFRPCTHETRPSRSKGRVRATRLGVTHADLPGNCLGSCYKALISVLLCHSLVFPCQDTQPTLNTHVNVIGFPCHSLVLPCHNLVWATKELHGE